MSSAANDRFICKKQHIIKQLAVPEAQYNDLSPKGSIDKGIRALVDEINDCDGFVTTSSCSGRITIFVEGNKIGSAQNDNEQNDPKESLAGPGGKGGGGKWLFVSHHPVEPSSITKATLTEEFGMLLSAESHSSKLTSGDRLIHFKFEPMIMHILTASLAHAQMVLSAALQAGFRESGAINLNGASSNPVVAVRSSGLMLESIVGYVRCEGNDESYMALVTDGYLHLLVGTANERFKVNADRIRRFRTYFRTVVATGRPHASKLGLKSDGESWEDASSRRERKRAEGLRRAAEIRDQENKMDPDLVSVESI